MKNLPAVSLDDGVVRVVSSFIGGSHVLQINTVQTPIYSANSDIVVLQHSYANTNQNLAVQY